MAQVNNGLSIYGPAGLMSPRGLAAADSESPSWFDKLMGYGTDVYGKYAELEAAQAAGASAAQIAAIQQEIMAMQQSAEFQRQRETRTMIMWGLGGAMLLTGWVVYNSRKEKTAPRRRRR